MSNGEPIIIKGGGSIEVILSNDTFPPDPKNPDLHYNAERHITRVSVKDDITGKVTPYPIPEGGDFTIMIEHSL